MNDLSIERACAEDAAGLGELYVASRRAALPFLTEVHGPMEMKVWLRDVLLPRGTTWVARSGGGIVGFMTLDGKDIDQLYLHPGHLRRGIGSALVAHAKAQSPERLELVTFQKNEAARAFYEAQGFVPFRFGDGTKNEEREPDVFYEWQPATPGGRFA
ncbi:MAG: GNAT family N-acetyltransferase [Pseudomonadota bacterium]